MRWTRVAWTVWLAPIFLGGCHTVYHPHHDHLAELGVIQSEKDITRAIHKKAHEAWTVVRCEYPRRMFTPEFHDGFIDGYTDYLDRGGDAQPPAVPPLRYTQNKKYFTPEGHVLVRDYFLGFKYGTDVAVATGQRQFLTVPVLIPEKTELIPSGPVDHTPAPPPPAISGSDRPVPPLVNPAPPVPQPLPAPKPMSKLPMPRLLPKGEKPGNVSVPAPIEPEGSKFGPVPPLRSIIPNPGVPTAPMPSIPTIPSVPPFPNSPSSQGDSPTVEQAGGLTLPEPPAEVPSLPAHVPTPPNRDVYVPLPPNHTAPAPLPANHPEPMKK